MPYDSEQDKKETKLKLFMTTGLKKEGYGWFDLGLRTENTMFKVNVTMPKFRYALRNTKKSGRRLESSIHDNLGISASVEFRFN